MKNSTFRENTLLRAWASGRATLNGWLSIPDANAAEAMAHANWDSLTVDMQHGLIDYRAALALLQAISTTEVVPLVRVPWLDEGIIMKMLDAGAYGIICPMIDTAAQAARLARACRYPPRGSRSFGPIRAGLYGGEDYAAHANDQLPVFAMIETQEAIGNLDEILAVEELTGVYVGPSDLSLAHGEQPVWDREGSAADRAMCAIVGKARAAGKRSGAHCGSVAYARRMIAQGADFATVGSDMRLMSAGAQTVVSAFRGADTDAA
ncbi:MAG: 2,4-dihydroxyhept-2-ene-1,7-dioic acid aldolase [Chitinivibrionales bacterium]|nr:2,4-dihydroxyhept-2-ene-1,7-dioic acid aldolase [Chitinivibrionales bacterium]